MTMSDELRKLQDEICIYAKDYGLDFFDVIFEMVDSDQVNSLAAFGGFPVRYPHWRFGMSYDQLSKGYTWGLQKIYEMVINTDPSYAYLVKGNSTIEQKLVMAHVYAHVDFFKNNYWFSKTNRKMLDKMANDAARIRSYMEEYGQDRVEGFIDRCLTIENLIDPHLPFANQHVGPKGQKDKHQYDEDEAAKCCGGKNHGAGGGAHDHQACASGGDCSKSKKGGRSSNDDYKGLDPFKLKVERSYMDSYINPKEFIEAQKRRMADDTKKKKGFPEEPQKDVMAFLLDHAPLTEWQHNVLTMIRDEAYYLVPQMQTKIMNEGWAVYWHARIMTEKALKDSEIIDFANAHAGTLVMQPGQINPYKVGVEIFRDIQERWDKGRFGKEYNECEDIVTKANWDTKAGLGMQKLFEVRRVYNDLTFIDEFLTPELVDRLKMYTYGLNRRTNRYEIVDRDHRKVKEKLLFQLTNLGSPLIYIQDGNFLNKGELLLWHKHQGLDLDLARARATLSAISKIWSRPAHIETLIEGKRKLYSWINGDFKEEVLDEVPE